MVRVLASGDVVADDDPRAQASSRHQQPSQRQMGRIRHGDDMAQGGYADGGGGGGGAGGGTSIFQVLNQKLLDAGIPRWNLGTTVIEPIVTVGFLLAMLLLGAKGLLLGGVLFAAVKFSGGGGGGGGGTGGQSTGRRTGGPGGRGGSGGGRVLGGR